MFARLLPYAICSYFHFCLYRSQPLRDALLADLTQQRETLTKHRDSIRTLLDDDKVSGMEWNQRDPISIQKGLTR